MKFTSITFAFFFLIVYFFYWNLPQRFKLYLIILSSFLFYSAWSPLFGIHFLTLGIINYILASWLFERKSKWILILILIVDIGNLVIFKYFYLILDFFYKITNLNFFTKENFDNYIYEAFGIPSIILPLAISFYTFVFIAFAIDTYKGKITEKENFAEYMTFIFFFPHLVAGPIIRHSDFFYQLKSEIKPSKEKISQGMYLILQGLLKKVVIADNIYPIINPIYQNPSLYDWQSLAIAVLGYSVRVYCDFSGYTDIARGLSKLLGLELPENFLAPYLTKNVRELWRKWHYTLATWIRDYIYIPLGGSRHGEWRGIWNLFIAFTLGGLWHGANYTFIVWGMWNGWMVAIERKLSKYLPFLNHELEWNSKQFQYYIYPILGFLYTTWVWLFGIAFFNSDTVENGWQIVKGFHTFQDGIRATGGETLAYMLVVTYFFNYLQKIRWEGFPPTKFGFILLFIFGIFVMLSLAKFAPEGAEFIYFQF